MGNGIRIEPRNNLIDIRTEFKSINRFDSDVRPGTFNFYHPDFKLFVFSREKNIIFFYHNLGPEESFGYPIKASLRA